MKQYAALTLTLSTLSCLPMTQDLPILDWFKQANYRRLEKSPKRIDFTTSTGKTEQELFDIIKKSAAPAADKFKTFRFFANSCDKAQGYIKLVKAVKAGNINNIVSCLGVINFNNYFTYHNNKTYNILELAEIYKKKHNNHNGVIATLLKTTNKQTRTDAILSFIRSGNNTSLATFSEYVNLNTVLDKDNNNVLQVLFASWRNTENYYDTFLNLIDEGGLKLFTHKNRHGITAYDMLTNFIISKKISLDYSDQMLYAVTLLQSE